MKKLEEIRKKATQYESLFHFTEFGLILRPELASLGTRFKRQFNIWSKIMTAEHVTCEQLPWEACAVLLRLCFVLQYDVGNEALRIAFAVIAWICISAK